MGKEERSVDSIQLCRIFVVGQKDLIVACSTGYTETYHAVPQSLCFKFQLEPSVLSSAKVLTPMIGDLVVAFTRKYSSDVPEKTSGILYKITYKLGKADKCVLLCGSEMVSVSWDNLIVLHRPGKE